MQTITGTEAQNGELFLQEHLHLIYSYVYSYVRNQQEAEDLTDLSQSPASSRPGAERAALAGLVVSGGPYDNC